MAVWPAFTLLIGGVGAIVVLAVRRPALALLGALALFAVEGSVKILLLEGETPLPAAPLRVAAGLIDLALAAAIVGLVVKERSSLRETWRRFDSALRVAAWLGVAWVALSVLQVFQSGDVAAGLAGFRLTQIYVAAILGGVLLFQAGEPREPILRGLLWLLAGVAAYGALRALIGPADLERTYAVSRGGVTEFQFGDVFRTVGSFSGAVGLASFMAPAAVFTFVVGLLLPRHRQAAWFGTACALIAIAGSQVRVALVAVAVGLVAVGALAVLRPGGTRRGKLVVVAALAGALAAGSAAALVAGSASAETRERARAFVDPLSDRSVRLRLATWEESIDQVLERPLGSGLGTVGASTTGTEPTVTTDNSYLKVLREQGLLGGLLFAAALLTAFFAVGRRLLHAGATQAPLGFAALGGFAAFLVLAGAGEYVEQPGKVLAWTLLGIAVAASAARVTDETAAEPAKPNTRLEAAMLAAGVLLAVAAVAVWAARAESFESTTRVFVVRGQAPPGDLEGYLRGLIGSEDVRGNIVEASGLLVDPRSLNEGVLVRPAGDAAGITVEEATPERARNLAYAVSVLVAEASGGALVAGPQPEPPELRRWTDRAVDVLPGALPRPAHPVLAAVAGLGFALLLYVLVELSSPAAKGRRGAP